jgi:hypothetical protein
MDLPLVSFLVAHVLQAVQLAIFHRGPKLKYIEQCFQDVIDAYLDDIYHMSVQDSHLFRLYIGDINRPGGAVPVNRC